MPNDNGDNHNDNALAELSKLRWVCRRGMRELDVVLREYLDNYYLNSNQREQQTFKQLLELEDPILFSILMNYSEPENSEQKAIIVKLQNLFSKDSI